MPSTLLHLAIAGLLGAVFLEKEFDKKAFGVISAVIIFPDLDTVLGLWIEGAHRTYFHNIFVVAIFLGVLVYDLRIRENSYIRSSWGIRGEKIAWASFICFGVAGIALDLFFNGVNVFFPIHDQFYALDGSVFFSTKRGIVQNIFDLESASKGTTETLHYRTGVDPSAGKEPKNVERLFLIADDGVNLLLTVTGLSIVAYKLRKN